MEPARWLKWKILGSPRSPKHWCSGKEHFVEGHLWCACFLRCGSVGQYRPHCTAWRFRQHRTSSPIRSLKWQNPHTAAPFDSAKYISARPYRWNFIKVRPRSGVRVLKNVKYVSTVCARCGSFVTVLEPNCISSPRRACNPRRTVCSCSSCLVSTFGTGLAW